MIGHVTYLSDDGMGLKFGREIKSGDIAAARGVEFQVESYLQYQGKNFAKSFDANTYIRMTRALDYFDPAEEYSGNLTKAMQKAQAKFLVISFSSDWRFSPKRSQEIVNALVASKHDVVSTCIESEHGHDSFLLPLPRYFQVLGGYLEQVASG
jgi:homoserine O-acetyltransferase